MRFFLSSTTLFLALLSSAQANYWQQAVDYKMDIRFDVSKHQFNGDQTLVYTNNSSDTLRQAFWHLYFNAFQPGSAMDVRSITISDPDSRVASRISQLKPDEIGYQKVKSLTQNGKALEYIVEGTVLEVKLAEPILPGASATFQMNFDGQVPVQIRRSGRFNSEGVDYSMAQWFPKMAEYDEMGWHSHPYIGREFYSPWGNYEVNITIDKDYVVAASGVLQNPDEMGAGYEAEGVKVAKTKDKTKTWRFKAEKVHDFMWAADPDYTQLKRTMKDGLVLRFFYIKNKDTENWDYLPEMTEKAFDFMEANFGEYPYPEFIVIQGGDGGMEYPMSTLITGHRSLRSLVGVTVHEAFHSWYQGLLATNESYFSWMDEGFTSYGTAETMVQLFQDDQNTRTHERTYAGYIRGATAPNFEEPLTTHADHYTTNGAYGWGAYTKGSVILAQLNYLLGEETFKRAFKKYFNQWKFKHPDLNDFVRVMEKESGLELHWYFEYMVNTTHDIDYAVKSVEERNGKTYITLKREGLVPMPVDVKITSLTGPSFTYYAALDLMRGNKPTELKTDIDGPDWTWTHPEYVIVLDQTGVTGVEIDASGWMADVKRENNVWKK
jgi:hypothetical protein